VWCNVVVNRYASLLTRVNAANDLNVTTIARNRRFHRHGSEQRARIEGGSMSINRFIVISCHSNDRNPIERSKPMIVRIVAVFVMLVALAPLQAPSAQASAAPIFAADTFLSALNAGDEEAAVAAFAPDAVATLARGDTYRGQAAMVDLVQLMAHAGRS